MFLIGLFFVCVVCGVAYYLSIQIVRIPPGEHTPIASEALLEGVSIVEKEGSRILMDNRAGYEMEIPDDVLLKTEGNRILFYSSDPDLPVLGGIHLFENKEDLSLEAFNNALAILPIFISCLPLLHNNTLLLSTTLSLFIL